MANDDEGFFDIFVAFSFDQADQAIKEWFYSIMDRPENKSRFRVVTAEPPRVQTVVEQIEEAIEQCDAVLAIFTRRYVVVGQQLSRHRRSAEMCLPSGFVLTEAAYALGRYSRSGKKVVALYEKGINRADLGLLEAKGTELVEFDRDRLAAASSRVQTYLDSLLTGQYANGGQYLQEYREKVAEVSFSGQVVIRNHVRIRVLDADYVNSQGIPHFIYVDPADAGMLSSLNKMISTPDKQYHRKPFFWVALHEWNQEHVSQGRSQVEVTETTGTGTPEGQIDFRLRFRQRLKESDVVAYRYVWAVPGLYSRAEDHYFELTTNLWPGRIDHASLALLLPTNYRLTRDPEFRISPVAGRPSLGTYQPHQVDHQRADEGDKTRYWFGPRALSGTIRALWTGEMGSQR